MGYRTYVIGRDNGCDLTISDGSVSRKHAELVISDGGAAMLSDRRSACGTFVRHKGKWGKIEHTALETGMRLRFGEKVEIDADRLIALALSDPGPTRQGAPSRAKEPDRGLADGDGLIRRNPDDGSILGA